jgi:regulation of enolase protein 1 (concanavalin A-like superfamily)
MTGTQLAITVPKGTAHDVWTSGNFVPQVQQAVSDTDFEVSVKFESSVNARFQSQGLLVQTDSENLIRFEVMFDGTGTKLFVATLTDGVASSRLTKSISIGTPHYLRVSRVWDQWTVAYSSDGVSWTLGGSFEYQLAVTTVGVFAGNAFGKVAHTAVIDYVFNAASPIDPEDGGDD